MTLTPDIDISVVIPAYNAERSLSELVERLIAAIETRGLSVEIVIVNDSSADGTWGVIEALADKWPQVRGVDLLANHGQPRATMCGLSIATGALVATIDDDFEHPPEQLPVLLDALEAHPGWDAVVGRWDRDGGAVRSLGSKLHAWADRLAWGTPSDFRHTAFRLIRRPAVDAVIAHATATPVIGPLLYRTAANVHNVDVVHGERSHGQSGFTVGEGVRRVVTNFTQGSTLPLRLLSVLGIVSSAAATLLALIITGRWIAGARGPQGWLSTFVATLFLGGLILLGIGVLGIYISTIVREVQQSPRWNVRRTTPEVRPVTPEEE